MGGLQGTQEASLAGLGDPEQEVRAGGGEPMCHPGSSQVQGPDQAGDEQFSGLDTQQEGLAWREMNESWAGLFTPFDE